MYCAHRINTSDELKYINVKYGIEVDLRDNLCGEIYLAHEPFVDGENFETFLVDFKHAFIILNIKSERIEPTVLEILKRFNISNYFFLDSSFPMIYKLITEYQNPNIAIRYSELEGLDTLRTLKGYINWVWVDCFTKNPLTPDIYKNIQEMGYRICFVSPELQNQPDKIREYASYFNINKIKLDIVCTKHHNIDIWKKEWCA